MKRSTLRRKPWRKKKEPGERVRDDKGKFVQTATLREILEDYLDALWSFGVKARDNQTDQFTLLMYGRNKQGLDPHHIFSRKHRGTRWDLDNGITVMGAHGFHEPHTNPELFRKFLIDRWFKSLQKYQMLHERSMSRTKWPEKDLPWLVIDMKGKIRDIINTKPDRVLLTEAFDALCRRHEARLDKFHEGEYRDALSKMQGGSPNPR